MINHSNATPIEIVPIEGLPEFHSDHDVATVIAHAAPWLSNGDIVVVTSKVISKSEGRIVSVSDNDHSRDQLRRRLVSEEAVRIVARKGRTWITQNRLGLVQAGAGIDGSNVAVNELALLPRDPDASARLLRQRLYNTLGVHVGVIITDTMGRAWRNGQVDVAIGASGVKVLANYRGAVDCYGNSLSVTEIALADEIAAAADLVKGKLGGIPVAVIRGLNYFDHHSSAIELIRPKEEELFWLGTAEAIELGRTQAQLLRRSIRHFSSQPVSEHLLTQAIGEALTAPAPHHSHPVRFVWVRNSQTRIEFLNALQTAWIDDLRRDGYDDVEIKTRISRGTILYDAPEIIIPFVVFDQAHVYPDHSRRDAERTMFIVAAGGAVQALLVALSVRGLGSCWVGSTIFAPHITCQYLQVPDEWMPLGAIALGYPQNPIDQPRTAAHTAGLFLQR